MILQTPRVSAICITDHRIDFLKRSTNCFLRQTYPNKELVVVFPFDDEETGEYLSSLDSPEIRLIPVDPSDPISLGEKRNLGIQLSDGYYFCTWDDDDWYHQDRIANQVAHLQSTGLRSTTLSNVLVYDMQEKEAFISYARPWEQTLLCERSVIKEGIRYGNLNKGEDSVLVSALKRMETVNVLFSPWSYIYIYHGGNTWHREHWNDNIFQPGKKLGAEFNTLVADILSGNLQDDSLLENAWRKIQGQ